MSASGDDRVLVDLLRSGNPVVDLRRARSAEIRDLSVFDSVHAELLELPRPRNLRVWVLTESVSSWARSAEQAREALRTLHRMMRRRDDRGKRVADAAVVPRIIGGETALIFLLRSLGLEVYFIRTGGGVPVHEVDLGDGLVAGMSGRVVLGERPEPPVLRRLNDSRDRLQEALARAVAKLAAAREAPAEQQRAATAVASLRGDLARIESIELDYIQVVLEGQGGVQVSRA